MKISKARLRQLIIEETEKHKQISEAATASQEDIEKAQWTADLEDTAKKVAIEIEAAVQRASGGDPGVKNILASMVVSEIRAKLLRTDTE